MKSTSLNVSDKGCSSQVAFSSQPHVDVLGNKIVIVSYNFDLCVKLVAKIVMWHIVERRVIS